MARISTMRGLRVFAGAVAVIALSAQARANDPRCNVPPYGMEVAEFKSFADSFGHLIVITQTLPALCNVKYSGTDRTGLYNLGFTDQDINSKSMGDLAIQLLIALKNLADKTK
jgi:hypothetical protein